MINLERRKQIMDILESEGEIRTNDLVKKLGVTGATVRADLRDLAREGAIERYHGGIMLPAKNISNDTENYMVRSMTHVNLKDAIGRAASEIVSNGDTIFMDASSTTFHMIRYMQDMKDITVITNGIHTALELQRNNNFKITLIGGQLRPHSGAIEGMMSREMLSRLSGKYYFVSGNGFSIDDGLSGKNFYELELKRICAERSRHVVALVDSTKIGSESATVFIPTSKIDYLITDDGISEENKRLCREKGINLIVAGSGN